MDPQQNTDPNSVVGNVAPPQAQSEPRLEPLGETWVTGVGSVQIGPRGRRFRWAVALGVVLIVTLTTVGGAFVLSGASGAAKSLTAGYAPKDTVAFVDLRADLPGDQHQNLADFMSVFPGFKDRAQFDGAFDEILNKITGSISPDLTYTSALSSWTSGEVSMAISDLGSVGAPSVDQAVTAIGTQLDGTTPALPMPTYTPPSGVLIVGLKDRAAGEKWVGSEIARTHVTFAAQTYAGTQLYVARQATEGFTAAYAFTDKVLVAGEVSAVKAALDAPSKGSLAGNANYSAAMKSLSGDAIATWYVDPAALLQKEFSMLPSTTGLTGGLAMPGMNLTPGSLPAWMAGSVRADSTRLTIEMQMPRTAGSFSSGNATSVLAPSLPGSTVAVLEIHSVGKLATQEIASLSKTLGATGGASADQAVKQIQDALARIGGLDWIGDASMVLTKTGSTYGGGLVVKTPDAATATGRKAMITNLISLAGSGSGITETDETYKGTTITMVGIPAGTGLPQVKIGIATKGDLLVAGYGDSFAKAVIDTTAASSLASQSDFQTVMSAVGNSNFEYGYWDVPATADQIGQAFFPANPAYYSVNYKPYVDHLGGVAFSEIDGSTVTMRLVITAR
jgi:hypothetical protein